MLAGLVSACSEPTTSPATKTTNNAPGLWRVYDDTLKTAKYIDLTHTIAPNIPVWQGFGPSRFGPATDPKSGRAYTYAKDGFEATSYQLATDQLGTQLDPPAHWAPEFPSIDELPPTYTLRPLVVISIVEQVAVDPGYHLHVSDIERWEAKHGRIPEGSVVMARSDWSSAWTDPGLAARKKFPGVSLAALKFLHEERRILFHGHEPLDTDTTPTLEGEHWLMHHGYAQAEGVAHLDEVAETGCLLAIGYPKFKGGLGGYARFVAICPPDWTHGAIISVASDAPLPRNEKILAWDAAQGVRTRR
jgi:kynurenine formamidase